MLCIFVLFFHFKNYENKKFIHNFYFGFQHNAISNRDGSLDRKRKGHKKLLPHPHEMYSCKQFRKKNFKTYGGCAFIAMQNCCNLWLSFDLHSLPFLGAHVL